MGKVDEQELEDIRRWSENKLQQWFDDSMMRYKAIGCGYGDAMSSVSATLMMANAGALAMHTDIPVREAAVTLGKLIMAMRKVEKESENNC